MKKFFPLAAAFALLFPCAMGAYGAVADTKEAQDERFVYEIDFSDTDPERVNADFAAAFTKENGYPRFEQVKETDGRDEEGHWFLENGVLARKNDIDVEGGGSTTNVAVLTFRTKLFLNFRATVEYRQGSSTWGWSALAFRQADEGMTGADDGAYCFVQGGGQATVWGRYCGSASPNESAPDPTYQGDQRHTMTVEVLGNDVSVSVDGVPKLTHTLPSSFYYEGYLSLLSLDNESYFYSLKIEELEEPEIVAKPSIPPRDAADTEDALDSLAKESKPFGELLENSYAPAVREGGENEPLLIGIVAACGGVAVLGAAATAIVILRRKREP